MHMSELTAETLENTLAGPDTGNPRRDHVLHTIAQQAGVNRTRVDSDARDAIEQWFNNADMDAVIGRDLIQTYGNVPRIELGSARIAIALAVPLCTLTFCCDAIDAPASVDMGIWPEDTRTVSVFPKGEGNRIMVPLSSDVYYDGWRLLVRRGMIPATVATALIARSPLLIVDHPVLGSERHITGLGEVQNGFDVFELDDPILGSWKDI